MGERAEQASLLGPALVEPALPSLRVAAEKRDGVFERRDRLLMLLRIARR